MKNHTRTTTAGRQETADIIGVDVKTLDRWVRDGCPVVKRGGRGVEWGFCLPDVIRWWGDRRATEAAADAPGDLAEIELRRERAKMLLAELELANARGEVALVREFELATSRAMAEIQTRVMQVPQRVVMQLLGETDETRFKETLSAELRTALESAADADLNLDDDDGEGDDATPG
jgi:phage terminase Nu1 subunit (DNA packaging protein)